VEDRWATFDCYGTLIDWNGGIGRELERLFGAARSGELLHAYHELEPQIQREDSARSYRRVMAVALARLGAPAEEEDALARIGVEVDLTVVASEIGSYKPARGHWDEFFARSGAARERHVHVAASLFHDIEPASALGLRTIWINRLGEEAEPQPDVELHSLAGLSETLDSLAA
jgi:2-haloacid dehalogenase